MRRRITAPKRRSKLFRLIDWLIDHSPWRELTPEELADLKEKKRRQEMENLLRSEAILFRKRIINVLNRRGVCYRYKKSEKDLMFSGVQSVTFDCIVMQPDAIYLRVDTLHLPRDVSIANLIDETVLTDLSIACQHRVSSQYSDKIGCWYIIERDSGVLGIPNHVKYSELLETIPPSADGLTVPLGKTTNGKPVYKSLSQMYSMLVGGTTGGGKSNLLNVMLCTLIRRNQPDRLQILMVDLKGGLEFGFYEGIPHLLSVPEAAPTGIIQERTDVPKLLQWLFHEGERRIKVLKEAGYKDIGRYNARHRKDHMPHLLLIVDEWADIKLEPKTGKESEELLINIASRFRAVGIHVVLCTQVPKSEVLNMRVKGVLPAKIAFSCPHNTMSMAILDNGHATNLQPAGRAVFQWQGEIQIQAPWINDDQVKATVKGAIDGKYENIQVGHDVTSDEVWRYALDNCNGWLSIRDLYTVFRDRGISRKELETWLDEVEGQELVIGTSTYTVQPGSGSRSRRLVASDQGGGDA